MISKSFPAISSASSVFPAAVGPTITSALITNYPDQHSNKKATKQRAIPE